MPVPVPVPVPALSAEAARHWLAAGSPPGPEPRPSASVCLLRAGDGGPEVLWIRRSRAMSFAPGMLAFPGGVVEAVDRRAGEGPLAAGVLPRAAVRELQEETGLVVPAAALQVLARWITPEHEPRRYDTTFLVAAAQDHAAVSVEALSPRPGEVGPGEVGPPEVDAAGWARPADLLVELAAGNGTCLPPTRAVLARLAAAAAAAATTGDESHAGLDAVLANLAAGVVARPVVPCAAWAKEPGGDVVLLLPPHVEDLT